MSFVNKLQTSEGGLIRIISASEQGKPAWFVLQLDSKLYGEYKLKLHSSKMDISKYGVIIESGWGVLTHDLEQNLMRKYKNPSST
jgi:hypothetical protein